MSRRRNRVRNIITILLMQLVLLLEPLTVGAEMMLPESEITYTPSVMIDQITNRTTVLPVYVYHNTTLYIKNNGTVVYKKTYQKEGRKKISILPQTKGGKLKFYLVYEGSKKAGRTITKNVIVLPKIAAETYSKEIGSPGVRKNITDQTTEITVRGKENTTVVIKNDKEVIKKVKFNNFGTKTVSIPKQEPGNLYFYQKRGNKRGSIITRTVKDVTAPEKATLTAGDVSIQIKGELGARVYLSKDQRTWKIVGCIMDHSKAGCSYQPKSHFARESKYYYVKLLDLAGNMSEVSKIEDPWYGEDWSIAD